MADPSLCLTVCRCGSACLTVRALSSARENGADALPNSLRHYGRSGERGGVNESLEGVDDSTAGEAGPQRVSGVPGEPEHALLAEIASMAQRLLGELESMRTDIAEIRDGRAPGSAAPSALRPPA